MKELIYFIVVLVSTTLGSITGMGGGVIIKPVLDLMNDFDISTINILTSITVFLMTVVSIVRYIKNGINIKPIFAVLLGIGSVIGGFLGEKLFSLFVVIINNNDIAKSIQSLILTAVLLLGIVYMRHRTSIKQFEVKSPMAIFLSGAFLGGFSSFLGIGGGPINVSLLMFLFSFDVKEAAVYSIVIIFFAQISKLLNVAAFIGFGNYDLNMLLYMIPSGIIGGLIGSEILKRLNNEKVEIIFNIVVIIVIAIAMCTAVKPLI